MVVETRLRSVGTRSDDPWARFSAEARYAWSRSALADFSPKATAYALQGATEARIPPGLLPPPRVGPDQDGTVLLIVSGLVRTFRRNETRQITTRYAGKYELVGIPALIKHGSSAHGEAIANGHMLRIVGKRLREVIRHDPESAWVVMREIARLHDAAVDMACDNVFLNVRQRVARHLLDLAVREPDGLVVYASHQDIADAIGSVREVVSRVIREMRAEALITRSEGRMVLTRPGDLVSADR
jgi:CRP-like cAMP-binding protein